MRWDMWGVFNYGRGVDASISRFLLRDRKQSLVSVCLSVVCPDFFLHRKI